MRSHSGSNVTAGQPALVDYCHGHTCCEVEQHHDGVGLEQELAHWLQTVAQVVQQCVCRII